LVSFDAGLVSFDKGVDGPDPHAGTELTISSPVEPGRVDRLTTSTDPRGHETIDHTLIAELDAIAWNLPRGA